jgi:hypothetical protein
MKDRGVRKRPCHDIELSSSRRPIEERERER